MCQTALPKLHFELKDEPKIDTHAEHSSLSKFPARKSNAKSMPDLLSYQKKFAFYFHFMLGRSEAKRSIKALNVQLVMCEGKKII